MTDLTHTENSDAIAARASAPIAERNALHDAEPGRLAVYAALSAMATTVPLPWLPDLAARSVRGALAHGVAARFDVALRPDARDVLAEPAGTEGPRGAIGHLSAYARRFVLRRFGPAALLAPARSALSVFALGHLLHRYFETARRETGPLDVVEARKVRRAIDRAVLHVISVEAEARFPKLPELEGDGRDATTRWLDAFLERAAGLPAWAVRRLEAAFDEVLPTTDG
jgi:hypothetical protein